MVLHIKRSGRYLVTLCRKLHDDTNISFLAYQGHEALSLNKTYNTKVKGIYHNLLSGQYAEESERDARNCSPNLCFMSISLGGIFYKMKLNFRMYHHPISMGTNMVNTRYVFGQLSCHL